MLSDSENASQIGWQDYLAIIVRRRWFFIVPIVIITTVGTISGFFMPKVYRAETIMLVEEQNVMNPLIQGLAVATPVGQRLRILREELLSWTSLSRLATELKLDKNATTPGAFEALIRRLQRDIHVRMRGSNLILINYEGEDPKLTQTVVNTITNIYMDRNIESQSAETATAISFIEKEMLVYKTKLESAEKSLREFQELYVMQMPVASQLNDQIVDLEVSLAQLRVENTEEHPTVKSVRNRIVDLKTMRNNEIKRVITTALAKGVDPHIYQDLLQALDEPTEDSDSLDPTVRAAKEAYQAWINRLEGSVVQQAAQVPGVQVVAVSPGIGGTGTGEQTIQVLGPNSASLSLGPREEQELKRLRRDYEVYGQTYQHLQNRLERAKITQRLGDSDEGTKFKILEPARLPLKHVRPNILKIFIFSLLMGMFVGAGVAFVAEYLDQSFQTAEDLNAVLNTPVIGTISTIVTEADIAEKRRQMKTWISVKAQLQRIKNFILAPVWAVVDRALVRWKM